MDFLQVFDVNFQMFGERLDLFGRIETAGATDAGLPRDRVGC